VPIQLGEQPSHEPDRRAASAHGTYQPPSATARIARASTLVKEAGCGDARGAGYASGRLTAARP
jgi:hypothetical protein